MPKTRDEQRYEEQRQRIIQGALEVFSRYGYRGATNKRIAAAAGGIAPGLIYHYFTDKQDLFRAVLEETSPVLQMASHPEELMALPPCEALRRIACGYLAVFQRPEVRRGLRLMVGEVVREDSEMRDAVIRQATERIFGMLAGYVQAQIATGTLRPVNPEIAARAFLGPLAVTALSRYLLEQPAALAITDDELVETAVSIFLDGLAVPDHVA